MNEKIKAIVLRLLRQNAKLRDSDTDLIANIWVLEIGYNNISQMTAMDLLSLFANGKLTSPETIRRQRQKAQEMHTELRGKSYLSRQREQINVKSFLKSY